MTNIECLGCKAFYANKDLKPGHKDNCFICNRELIVPDYSNMFGNPTGGMGGDPMDMFDKMFGGKN